MLNNLRYFQRSIKSFMFSNKRNKMLFIPGKTTIQVSGRCSRFEYYTREICLNHQSEALPRFYVISVDRIFPDQFGAKPFVGLPYKSKQFEKKKKQKKKQFEYCQQQNFFHLLMAGNPFPGSFDGKDFVALKIKVSYFS